MANRVINTLYISVFTAMIGLGIIYPLIPTLAKNSETEDSKNSALT